MKTPYLAILRSLATIPPPAHLNTASLLSIHERTQKTVKTSFQNMLDKTIQLHLYSDPALLLYIN